VLLLENRCLPSVFTVTTTADAGPGSLRQAILDSNSVPGGDLIQFAIPGMGLHTIQPLSALPEVSDSVRIDGYSQPGSSPNTLAVGDDAVLQIELDGSRAGAASGLVITAGGSVVRGLVIDRFGLEGITLRNLGANVVEGNFVGTDPTGTTALGNGIRGVFVDGSPDNRIGGTAPHARNVLSGNQDGIGIDGRAGDASGNQVLGNFIGTDATGAAALGNISVGVRVVLADRCTVGGAETGAGNVISANKTGISLSGHGHVVQGNLIGTDGSGTHKLGNTYDGIFFSGVANDAADILVRSNVIVGGTFGVEVAGAGSTANRIEANFIGTNAMGTTSLGNSVSGVFLWKGANHNTVGGTPGIIVRGNPFRNVISGNGAGVVISGSGTAVNQVVGNFIGTDVTGAAALGNVGAGVRVEAGASRNTIGGAGFGAGNVISGNAAGGVFVLGPTTSGTVVQGNTIGTDATGSRPLGNGGDGVLIDAANSNTVGGSATGARNLISSNARNGVAMVNSADSNVVNGNFIGTDTTGKAALGNGGNGVSVDASDSNTVGTPGATNLISGNLGNGVEIRGDSGLNVVNSNYIGTAVGGLRPLGNVGDGVLVLAADNRIGRPGAGNVIVANRNGVVLRGVAATANVVSSNSIGLTLGFLPGPGNREDGVLVDGGASDNTVELNGIQHNGSFGVHIRDGAARNVLHANTIDSNFSDGVEIVDSPGNVIGLAGASVSNSITRNGDNPFNIRGDGVSISGVASVGNVVQNNLIESNFTEGVILFAGASNNSVGGTAAGAGNLISGNLGGVYISSLADGNRVQGNYIGRYTAGSGKGNLISGVQIDSASNNLIGGTTPAARNVISGNGSVGVEISQPSTGSSATAGNVVQGNFIGTDVTGTIDLGNGGNGVRLDGDLTVNTLIGGTAPGAGNLISGNGGRGVLIWPHERGVAGTVIQGNLIGTDVTGLNDIGNSGAGIEILNVSGVAIDNVVGGVVPTAANTIAFNDRGVWLQGGTGTAILTNSIFSNDQLGIDLGPSGVTINDALDTDTGPNGLQNFPTIAVAPSVALGPTMVAGTLGSEPLTTYLIQFFVSNTGDSSGFGEGATLLGSTTVTTTSVGAAAFAVTLPPVAPGKFITATATRMVDDDGSPATPLVPRDTSEFSAWRKVIATTEPFPDGEGVSLSGRAPTPAVPTPDGSSDARARLWQPLSAPVSVQPRLRKPNRGTSADGVMDRDDFVVLDLIPPDISDRRW